MTMIEKPATRQQDGASPTIGVRPALQLVAILFVAMVAGSTFGTWRGYDLLSYSPATFLEVHRETVRGLNVLLPSMAFVAIGLTGILAFLSRKRRTALILYCLALAAMLAAGFITRFVNQPINAQVMTWTADALPANWENLRSVWWHWHVVRTLVTIIAAAILIAAVLVDCRHAHRD